MTPIEGKIAKVMHTVWSVWMVRLLSNCEHRGGQAVIRWSDYYRIAHLTELSYDDLPVQEKAKYQEQVEMVMWALNGDEEE